MNVFLSFSGDYAKRHAVKFKNFLENTLQTSEGLISSEIKGGDYWFPEILDNLNKAKFGIAFLTRSNQSSPWVNFEVGYIRGKEGRKCTGILLDFDTSELIDPIKQINHKKLNKEDIKNLIQDINDLSETPIKNDVLNKAFDRNWIEYENSFKKIVDEHEPEPSHADMLKAIIQQNQNIYSSSVNSNRTNQMILHNHVKDLVTPDKINGYLDKMTKKEAEVLRLYLGFERFNPLNQYEIADRFDVDPDEIFEIIHSGLQKIKD